jgi:hypothetical protein
MRVWTAAALTVAAVVGLGFVQPFGNPRVEPAEGLGTRLQGTKMPADAKLSKADVHAISMLGKSTGSSDAMLGGPGDTVRGKAVFEKR